MELSRTRRRTAWPSPLAGGWARIRKAIAVATTAAALFGTISVLSAQREQQGDARNTVQPDSPLTFTAVLPSGQSVQVYRCGHNQADEAIENDCYIYVPPLTLDRDPAGRVPASVTPSGGVRVRMQGVSPAITYQLHTWLVDEQKLPPARREGSLYVQQLDYHQIRIIDADREEDARWQALSPGVGVTQVPREWIPFVFTPLDGVSESPSEFIDRLNDPQSSALADRDGGVWRHHADSELPDLDRGPC